jgi:uncharacterized protein YqeY
MPELKQRIVEDMKSAMKAKDKEGLKAIRMILGAIKQREVDERIELVDEQVLAVIRKMVKQRKDSISQFKDCVVLTQASLFALAPSCTPLIKVQTGMIWLLSISFLQTFIDCPNSVCTDLIEIEEAELVVINNYMPAQLSENDITKVVDKAIAESGASSNKARKCTEQQ